MIVGAVLVGGQSQRMGQPKALIAHHGLPLVEHLGLMLQQVCSSVIAIGPNELTGSVPHVADLYPGQGPLGAIITGLSRLARNDDQLLAVACDLMMLDVTALRRLVDGPVISGRRQDCDVVMAITDRPQPLCARWNAHTLPTLAARFEAGERSLLAAASHLRVGYVECPPEQLSNVNTPDDLRRVQTRLA